MTLRHWSLATAVTLATAGGFALHAAMDDASTLHAAAVDQRNDPPTMAPGRVFELRTYTAAPGKFADLNARFRNHVLDLFAKHGLKPVDGYWTPIDGPQAENTIVYVLVHESREAADRNWAAFQADPEWITAKAESEKNGPLTTSVTRVWLHAADFSPVR